MLIYKQALFEQKLLIFFAFRINHVQPVFDLNTRFWKLKADFQFDGNFAT